MKIYTFNIEYTAHASIEVEGQDDDEAKDNLEAELDFMTDSKLDNYHVVSSFSRTRVDNG